METPTPSVPGKVDSPHSAPVTSHTLSPQGGGDLDYDQTIKIKTPGSGMMAFNRYKLDRVLGRGGMGVVWLAEDTKLERPVALKFLPSLIGLDPAAVKELKTETRRGLELSHPHIVRIYDFVDDEDAAAISMEFVDGKTLSELRMTTEHGVFTVEEISQWLLGVCDALDYAHFQRKLIHRDLKPANIMLAGKDAVGKIADFGIARSLSDTMSRLSAAHIGTSGTLPYMSPQQAMGERPMPTDDVYSLGATLYELLSGKPPFYRGDLPTQINSKVPPSMQERRAELDINAKELVPKLWEDAIGACLHKEPEMRPSCAGALAEMLGLKPLTVTVRTGAYAAATARAVAERKQKRVPLIAAAATLVVGAGAAAYFFLNTPPLEDKKTDEVAATTPVKKSPETKPKASAKKAETNSSPNIATTAPTDTPKVVPPPVPVTLVSDTPEVTPVTPTVAMTQPASVTPPVVETPAPSATTPPTESSVPPASTVEAGSPPAVAVTPQPVVPTMGPDGSTSPSAPATGGLAVSEATTPPPGDLSLTPDATGATSGALASMTPPIPGAPMPLPPGVVIPPGSPLLTQQDVPQPATGFWTIDQVFPVIPHASYSPKGKQYILYKTQSALKEQGLYTSTVDGAEGKGTHNAIVLFQVRNGLVANGLLDLPTLAALNLSAEPDKPDWSSPSGGGGSSGGYRRRTVQKEEPGFLQKTGDTLKRLNPFGK